MYVCMYDNHMCIIMGQCVNTCEGERERGREREREKDMKRERRVGERAEKEKERKRTAEVDQLTFPKLAAEEGST